MGVNPDCSALLDPITKAGYTPQPWISIRIPVPPRLLFQSKSTAVHVFKSTGSTFRKTPPDWTVFARDVIGIFFLRGRLLVRNKSVLQPRMEMGNSYILFWFDECYAGCVERYDFSYFEGLSGGWLLSSLFQIRLEMLFWPTHSQSAVLRLVAAISFFMLR